MRLFLASFLLQFIGSAYALTCRNYTALLYGDLAKVKSYKLYEQLGDWGKMNCSGKELCTSSYQRSWNGTENYGYIRGLCARLPNGKDTGCGWVNKDTHGKVTDGNIHEGFRGDIKYCVCSKDLCNSDVEDAWTLWEKHVTDGDSFKDDMKRNVEEMKKSEKTLKCYHFTKAFRDGKNFLTSLNTPWDLHDNDPTEFPCIEGYKCLMKVEAVGNGSNFKSFSLGCQMYRDTVNDGCVVSGEEVNCYCSSNRCFTPEMATATMEEFASTKTVTLSLPEWEKAKAEASMNPGGNPAAGGQEYPTGNHRTPALFTSSFIVVVAVLTM